jgi:hypothetical protein
METERITLSQRERDRLKVLHEVRQRGSRAVPGSGPPALKSGPRDNWATRA